MPAVVPVIPKFFVRIFGVVSPDARLQRPEYLGGSSTRILMNSVAQTAATNDVTPQANLRPLACSVIVSMASLNRLWSMATSSVLLMFVLTFLSAGR